jgi:hypothetical protein
MKEKQTLIALTLISALLLGSVCLSFLSRSSGVVEWLENSELTRFREGDGLFMNRGAFIDFEDRMVIDEIPKTPFNDGGIYFFGHSTLKWATAFWQLRPDQKSLLHNFGIGASNHRDTAQFIDYLLENEGLSPKSGAPVTAVLGCTWSMSLHWRNGFFSQLWGRYGLYRYDERTGVHKLTLSPVQRWWLSERARLGGFVSTTLRRGFRAIASAFGIIDLVSARQSNPAVLSPALFQSAEKLDWKAEHELQMAALKGQIRLLNKKNIRVKLALMPTRLGYKRLPFPAQYISDVRSLAKTEGIELLDLSDLLNESEFADLNHANYLGLQKTHEALMRYVEPETLELTKKRLQVDEQRK